MDDGDELLSRGKYCHAQAFRKLVSALRRLETKLYDIEIRDHLQRATGDFNNYSDRELTIFAHLCF